MDMARRMGMLSVTKINALKDRGFYCDGGGLYLQVAIGGSKSWVFRYKQNGKARDMGLGPLHTVSLAEAREAATAKRKLRLDGIDPIAARQEARAEIRLKAAKSITFKNCAEQFIDDKKAEWKNAKHSEQWTNTLATYSYPFIGDLPVASVDTGLVLKVLRPIWKTKTETAKRLRGRIESVLNWAKTNGYREGDNPASWRGHLQNSLATPSKIAPVKHHCALPYAEIAGFMAELRALPPSVSAHALELTILTVLRTSEAIGAQWSEIDLAAKVWTVPAARMKMKREHRVPLSDRAVEILKARPRRGKFVFPGAKAGKPLSNMAMLELMRGMRGMGATVHGMRSCFRDWAADCTNHPNHVVEMALAHAIDDKTEAAYRRSDLFKHRARLMRDWSAYCALPAGNSNVVTFAAARQ
jgi:integrase